MQSECLKKKKISSDCIFFFLKVKTSKFYSFYFRGQTLKNKMKKLFEAELEDFHESSRAGWKRCSRKTRL